MGKGNILVDKSMIKMVVEGKIIIPLPKVLVENRYYPMFSICSPIHCDDCGSKLHVNSHYTRFILSSYGTIARDVTYWFCPVCEKHFHDQIIGVPGPANYNYEYYEKQMNVRYDGRCSLHNSRRIAVLHQLDQKIIYPHYDFKHLTEKYFEIGMKLDDFLIQLVKY